jgi:hypothetical protein
MRKLIAICALLLSASAAQAQTDKAPAVTKLPGEEKLSTRERAERDFLMPTRHKKMAEVAKVTAQADQDATASPELDATAHYTEATEARPDEVAVVTRTERRTALRHYSHSRSARHHSKATAAKRTTKASAHRSIKKTAAHKTKAKTKKVTATKSHRATKKTVTKAKTTHRKRRR